MHEIASEQLAKRTADPKRPSPGQRTQTGDCEESRYALHVG
jgi:hypothetical protein